ncbi:hypothetical protein MHBO_001262 [Bonamia ostreae]|uniref:Uncharacterized protein n=1 Tax=Bonamia ostreae TaxID=126728 RepID=A0ABV2AIZ1_9EUKA
MFLFGKRFFSGSALQLSIEKFNYALLEGSLPVGSVVEFADGSFGIVNFVVKKRVLALTFNRKVREGAGATALHNRFLFKFEFSSFGSCVDVLGRPVLGSEPANRRTALAQLLEDRFGHKKVFLDVSGRECVPFLKRVRLKSVYRFRDLLLDSFCPVPYGSSLGIFGDRFIFNVFK